ncbi:MAG: DUF3160 domain-containing protein [bacterium]
MKKQGNIIFFINLFIALSFVFLFSPKPNVTAQISYMNFLLFSSPTSAYYGSPLYYSYDSPFTPIYFPMASYLSPEFISRSPKSDVYHYTLFLPSFINTYFEYPYEFSWLFPFQGRYTPEKENSEELVDDFLDNYLLILEEAEDLRYQDLVEKFPEGEYSEELNYSVNDTVYYDLVKNEMGLTPEEEEKINENGFVVSRRKMYGSFGEAYLDCFSKDLPVFISTDSILHALHRSYDVILAELEKWALMDKLELILSQAQTTLGEMANNSSGMVADAYHDVNVFYTVARELLKRYKIPPPLKDDEQVQDILHYVNGHSFNWIELFGEERKIDFSQFIPRGHYTQSEELERYFQAMIWLGRIDFRIEEQRQLLDAYLIWRSIEESGALSAWDDMDRVIRLMIGEPDSMTLNTMAMLMDEAGVESPEELMDEEMIKNILRIMNEKGYGEQRICSHYIESDPLNPQVASLPKSFTLMGQRFTVDSHIFSNVVFDRVVVDNQKILRMMPDPLDAMFVLGNNRALHYLEDELKQWPYQGNLFILRYLLDQYESDFWESNIYNMWLNALRSLSGPFKGEGYPATMLTPAYRDKLLNTQLASWAELRHDTILYVKQSYTAYILCEYPDGYVEPLPGFYEKLEYLASQAKDTFSSIDISSQLQSQYISYYTNFAETMRMLRTLAQKQIDGQPRTEEEIQFIKDTIIEKRRNVLCAWVTVYEGWYPRLFYSDNENCLRPDFIVADVHTDSNTEQVLHVGTGKVHTIFFTADNCDEPALYVGPVFSYYEKVEDEMKRLTDNEWAELIKHDELTAPWWTASFLTD